MASSIFERCFVYSREQHDEKVRIETEGGGKKPKFGTVIIKGVPKIYTDIVTSMDKTRFSDSVLLIKGDIRTIKFVEPSN